MPPTTHTPVSTKTFGLKHHRLRLWAQFLIYRCVASKSLSCGCFVGIYEMFSGQIARVVDAPSTSCERHVVGEIISETPTA
jgi:hypothetical protein